jgi:hypothetical protein
MTSTAVLTDDSTTIVTDNDRRVRWGAIIAGALAATATSFFLLVLGAGVGLAFLTLPATDTRATSFLTLGAIYFLAAQAFGFAVGGYLVGRLIGPEGENRREEEFLAAAHGLTMWALVVVASILLAAASSTVAGSALVAGAAARDNSAAAQSYWVDEIFRPALYSPQLAADKAESGRILALSAGRTLSASDEARIAHLVALDAGISQQAGMVRVQNAEADMRRAADNARKAASILTLWTAFALLFGAIVAVAAAISARWLDDRVSFSLAPRY